MRLLHNLDEVHILSWKDASLQNKNKDDEDVKKNPLVQWTELLQQLTIQGGYRRHRDTHTLARILSASGVRCTDEKQMHRLSQALQRMFIPKLVCEVDAGAGAATSSISNLVHSPEEEREKCNALLSLYAATLQSLSRRKAVWGWLGYHESAFFRLKTIVEAKDLVGLNSYLQSFCEEMSRDREWARGKAASSSSLSSIDSAVRRASTFYFGHYNSACDDTSMGETGTRDTSSSSGSGYEGSLGYNIWSVDTDYENCLHACVHSDFVQGTRLLLTYPSAWVRGSVCCNQRNRSGDTPLHVAARTMSIVHLSYLLDAAGVDVMLLDAGGKNALHLLLLRVQTSWARQRQLLDHHAVTNDVRHRLTPSPAGLLKIVHKVLDRASAVCDTSAIASSNSSIIAEHRQQMAMKVLAVADNCNITALEYAVGTKSGSLVLALLAMCDLFSLSKMSVPVPVSVSVPVPAAELLRRLLRHACLGDVYDVVLHVGGKMLQYSHFNIVQLSILKSESTGGGGETDVQERDGAADELHEKDEKEREKRQIEANTKARKQVESELASHVVLCIDAGKGQALRALLALTSPSSSALVPGQGVSFCTALNAQCCDTGLLPLQFAIAKLATVSPYLPPSPPHVLKQDKIHVQEVLGVCRLLLREGASPTIRLGAWGKCMDTSNKYRKGTDPKADAEIGGGVDNLFALAAAVHSADLIRILVIAAGEPAVRVRLSFHASNTNNGVPSFYVGSELFYSNPVCACLKERSANNAAGECLSYLLAHSPFGSLVNLPDGTYTGTEEQHYLLPLAMAASLGDVNACRMLIINGAITTLACPPRTAHTALVSDSATTATTATDTGVAAGVKLKKKLQSLRKHNVDRAHKALVISRLLGTPPPSLLSLQYAETAHIWALREHMLTHTNELHAVSLRLCCVTSDMLTALLKVATGVPLLDHEKAEGEYNALQGQERDQGKGKDKGNGRGSSSTGNVSAALARVSASVRSLIQNITSLLKCCRSAIGDSNVPGGSNMRHSVREWGKDLFRKPTVVQGMRALTEKLIFIISKFCLTGGAKGRGGEWSVGASDVQFSITAVLKFAQQGTSELGKGTGAGGKEGWKRYIQGGDAQRAVELLVDFCKCVAKSCSLLAATTEDSSPAAIKTADTEVADPLADAAVAVSLYGELGQIVRAAHSHMLPLLFGAAGPRCITSFVDVSTEKGRAVLQVLHDSLAVSLFPAVSTGIGAGAGLLHGSISANGSEAIIGSSYHTASRDVLTYGGETFDPTPVDTMQLLHDMCGAFAPLRYWWHDSNRNPRVNTARWELAECMPVVLVERDCHIDDFLNACMLQSGAPPLGLYSKLVKCGYRCVVDYTAETTRGGRGAFIHTARAADAAGFLALAITAAPLVSSSSHSPSLSAPFFAHVTKELKRGLTSGSKSHTKVEPLGQIGGTRITSLGYSRGQAILEVLACMRQRQGGLGQSNLQIRSSFDINGEGRKTAGGRGVVMEDGGCVFQGVPCIAYADGRLRATSSKGPNRWVPVWLLQPPSSVNAQVNSTSNRSESGLQVLAVGGASTLTHCSSSYFRLHLVVANDACSASLSDASQNSSSIGNDSGIIMAEARPYPAIDILGRFAACTVRKASDVHDHGEEMQRNSGGWMNTHLMDLLAASGSATIASLLVNAVCEASCNVNGYGDRAGNGDGDGEARAHLLRLACVAAENGNSFSLPVLLRSLRPNVDEQTNFTSRSKDNRKGQVNVTAILSEMQRFSRERLLAAARPLTRLCFATRCHKNISDGEGEFEGACGQILRFVQASAALLQSDVSLRELIALDAAPDKDKEGNDDQTGDFILEDAAIRRRLIPMLLAALTGSKPRHQSMAFDETIFEAFYTKLRVSPIVFCSEIAKTLSVEGERDGWRDWGREMDGGKIWATMEGKWKSVFIDHLDDFEENPAVRLWYTWLFCAFTCLTGARGDAIERWYMRLKEENLIVEEPVDTAKPRKRRVPLPQPSVRSASSVNGGVSSNNSGNSKSIGRWEATLNGWLATSHTLVKLHDTDNGSSGDMSAGDGNCLKDVHHAETRCWINSAEALVRDMLSAKEEEQALLSVRGTVKNNIRDILYTSGEINGGTATEAGAEVWLPEQVVPLLCFNSSDLRRTLFGSFGQEQYCTGLLLKVLKCVMGEEAYAALSTSYLSADTVTATASKANDNADDDDCNYDRRYTGYYENSVALLAGLLSSSSSSPMLKLSYSGANHVLCQYEAALREENMGTGGQWTVESEGIQRQDKGHERVGTLWARQQHHLSEVILLHCAYCLRAHLNTACIETPQTSCIVPAGVAVLLAAIRSGRQECVLLVLSEMKYLSAGQQEGKDIPASLQRWRENKLVMFPISSRHLHRLAMTAVNPLTVPETATGSGTFAGAGLSLSVWDAVADGLKLTAHNIDDADKANAGWTVLHACLTGRSTLREYVEWGPAKGLGGGRGGHRQREHVVQSILQRRLVTVLEICAPLSLSISFSLSEGAGTATGTGERTITALDLAANSHSWANLERMLLYKDDKRTEVAAEDEEVEGGGKSRDKSTLDVLCQQHQYFPMPLSFSSSSSPLPSTFSFLHTSLSHCRLDIWSVVRMYILRQLSRYELCKQSSTCTASDTEKATVRHAYVSMSTEQAPRDDRIEHVQVQDQDQHWGDMNYYQMGKQAFQSEWQEQRKQEKEMKKDKENERMNRSDPASFHPNSGLSIAAVTHSLAFCKSMLLSSYSAAADGGSCSSRSNRGVQMESQSQSQSLLHAAIIGGGASTSRGTEEVEGAEESLAMQVLDLTECVLRSWDREFPLLLSFSARSSPPFPPCPYPSEGLVQSCVFYGQTVLLRRLLGSTFILRRGVGGDVNKSVLFAPMGTHKEAGSASSTGSIHSNYKDMHRWAPLQLAAYCNRGDAVKLLLETLLSWNPNSARKEKEKKEGKGIESDAITSSSSPYAPLNLHRSPPIKILRERGRGGMLLADRHNSYAPFEMEPLLAAGTIDGNEDDDDAAENGRNAHALQVEVEQDEQALNLLLASSLSLALTNGCDLSASYLLQALIRRVPITSPGLGQFLAYQDQYQYQYQSQSPEKISEAVSLGSGKDKSKEKENKKEKGIFPSLFCRSCSDILDPVSLAASPRTAEHNYGILLTRLVQLGMLQSLKVVLHEGLRRMELAQPKSVSVANQSEESTPSTVYANIVQHVQQQWLRLHAIVEMLFNEAAGAGHTGVCAALLDHLQEARVLLKQLLYSASGSGGASVSGKDGLCLCTDIIIDAPTCVNLTTLAYLLELCSNNKNKDRGVDNRYSIVDFGEGESYLQSICLANTVECAEEMVEAEKRLLERELENELDQGESHFTPSAPTSTSASAYVPTSHTPLFLRRADGSRVLIRRSLGL